MSIVGPEERAALVEPTAIERGDFRSTHLPHIVLLGILAVFVGLSTFVALKASAGLSNDELSHVQNVETLPPLIKSRVGDHVNTSDAAIAAIRRTGVSAIAYAELPYAVDGPAFVGARIGRLEDLGISAKPYPTPIGELRLKHAAWDCYSSQHVHLDVTGWIETQPEVLFRVSQT